MKFSGACLITDDVARLGNFYQGVLRAACDREEDYISFSTAGAHLSIFSRQEMEAMAPGSAGGAGCGHCTLEFEVEDVDAEHMRLVEMGIPIVKSPTTQPWGIRSVWFRDPDGNLVNLYARVSDPQPKPIEERVREYFHRALNDRDLQVFDEMLSHDYVDHDAPPDAPTGPQEPRQFIAHFLETYPDLRVEVEDVLAAGDRAAARLIWLGHHRETGELFHQSGLVMLRFNEQGKIAERWSVYRR